MYIINTVYIYKYLALASVVELLAEKCFLGGLDDSLLCKLATNWGYIRCVKLKHFRL